MAVLYGNDGTVQIISGSTNVLAQVTSFSLGRTSDSVSTTSMPSGGWSSSIGVVKRWNVSIECNYSHTDTTGQDILDAGDVVETKLYPSGTTSGDTFYTGSVLITSVDIAVVVDSLVTVSFSGEGTGPLVKSKVV